MYSLSLEPIIQYFRIQKVLPYLPRGGVLVDVGCDYPPKIINMVKYDMDFCIGLDSEVPNVVLENVELKQCFIKKTLPVESELADVVTMLAVLEHMEYPRAVIQEIYRILKPGGIILLTVPSLANRPLLEMFARVGLVRKEMIRQHKNYFSIKQLTELLSMAGFRSVHGHLFQLGLNTFIHAVK